MFTLLPLLTGKGPARRGQILSPATELVDSGKLEPLVSERSFGPADLAEAYAAAAAGVGKTVVDINI